MLDFISERFFYSGNLSKEIKRIVLIGIIFALFFSFVSPLQPGMTGILLLKIGLLTIIISILAHFVLHKVVIGLTWNVHWTIGREIIKSMTYFILIATGLYLILGLIEFVVLDMTNFFKFVGFTSVYGAIPAVLRTMSVQNKRLAKQLRDLSNIVPKDYSQKVELISPVKSDSFSCQLTDLVYFKSDENYLLAIEKERKTHIRLTMKSAMEQLEGFPFQRVHRSYLVNGQHVIKVRSNHLILEGNIKIPISRHFRKEFVEKEADN